MLGQYIKLGYDRFPLQSFQFKIHYHAVIV
jgi:hypothetical protein